jgi:UDP-N-acetylglucosamine 4-epimerase
MGINKIKKEMSKYPKNWLITGVAGFIGSNLLEELLKLGQTVIGLDNFSAGYQKNLDDVKAQVGEKAWQRFTFIKGDIRNIEDCRKGCSGIDFVLHHAALGSVPLSIKNPITTNESNVNGFINMLVAARDTAIKRFVYAGSSAIYGDNPDLPKAEDAIGKSLSPYATTKHINELYATVFAATYDMECIGLRYFNVFGSRQDPEGAYAAVIPRWIGELSNGTVPTIFGDGKSSRDFCYIENVIEANLLAAFEDNPESCNQIYNIACGVSTTLNELYEIIRDSIIRFQPEAAKIQPRYADFRTGDVRYSEADISKAKRLLGYVPACDVSKGLNETVQWFVENMLGHQNSKDSGRADSQIELPL